MPSFLHEALVALFRNRPGLAAELLRGAIVIPAGARYVARDSDLGEPVPSERRADLVFEVHDERAVVRGALVLEVQLSRDGRKRFSWPLYLMSLRSRIRAPVLLVVIAPERRVARWATKPIETGHPGFALRPFVIGPGQIPIATEEDVVASPELGVLSFIAHGSEPRIASLCVPLMVRIGGLDDERGRLYTDLVLSAARHELVKAALEAAMEKMKYEYQSDFARKYYGAGRAEGRAEAVISVLQRRGIPVAEDERRRILASRDNDEIDRWFDRAFTAATAAELFR